MAGTTTKHNLLDGLTKAEVLKMTPEEQGRVKNSLLSKALTILKERHAQEYEGIAVALFAEFGLERVRRLTQEEKDFAEYKRLQAKLGLGAPMAAEPDDQA